MMEPEKKKPRYIVTTVRLTPETVEKMKRSAESVGMAQSSYIRFAIISMIERAEKGIL